MFEDLSALHLAGLCGVAFYLGSYAALQLGLISGRGYVYPALNALAAALVLLSLVEAFNFSSAVIQIMWIIISVIGIGRLALLSYRSRFNKEERDFLNHAGKDMSRLHARRLLDLGKWHTTSAMTILTRTGAPVSHLIYLASGTADVIFKGKVIATLEEKCLIGEITAMSGEPATATVVTPAQSRILAIPVAELRSLLERDSDMRIELHACFAQQMCQKLLRANNISVQKQAA